MRTAALASEGLDITGLLEARIAALEARMARFEAARSRLSRGHLARLERLLPAWSSAVGSEPIKAGELVAHPAPGLRLVLDGMSAWELGNLLRLAVDVPVSGYMVEKVGTESHAKLWRLVGVPELERAQDSGPPSRARRTRAE